MKRRKVIALICAIPEHIHGRRIADGIFSQCEKYGYNVAVFAPLTHLKSAVPNYLTGEKNIYELINTDIIDGMILDTITLTEDETGDTLEALSRIFGDSRKVPTVCIGIPYKDLPVIENKNEQQLRLLCRHVIERHGKRSICVLTGSKGNHEAEERLRIILDEISSYGITVSDEHIVYGDFWYTSGGKLAEDIAQGRISKPDAIICASDHMAMGAVQKFTELGIKVPEDIIVTGFEATAEAAMDDISVTSCESNFAQAAAECVDYLRSVIDPDEPIIPYEIQLDKMLHLGKSCGCEADLVRSANAFREALYYTSRNYNSEILLDNIDIGLLMETYVSEQFTSSETPEKCIENIYYNTYLVMPFVNFKLCLKEDWLDTDHDISKGYPDKMKVVLANSSVNGENFFAEENRYTFDTSLMIPELFKESVSPSVFYFSAVHFNETMLGYAVLQRDLTDRHKINLVYRNWLRLVNNSLEMMRAKYRYMLLSNHDKMTGLYNRRGMYNAIEKMLHNAVDNARVFAAVIDMDGLKYINDTFGHSEGDFGIIGVGTAAQAVTMQNEICVRAGGDEFFIVGIGEYADNSCEDRVSRFEKAIAEVSQQSKRGFPILASIGCSMTDNITMAGFEEALSAADEQMYSYKMKRKRKRGSILTE